MLSRIFIKKYVCVCVWVSVCVCIETAYKRQFGKYVLYRSLLRLCLLAGKSMNAHDAKDLIYILI